jgi:hypothetical protein
VVTVATRLGIGLVSGALLGTGVGRLVPRRRVKAESAAEDASMLSP